MRGKPRILLMGDSIRMAYYPLVAKLLENEAEVVEIPENGDHTAKTKKKLKKWLKGLDGSTLALVHFNNGAHDIKRLFDKKKNRTPLEKYLKNQLGIIKILRASTPAKLIWATTTPVMQDRHFRVEKTNFIAADQIELYNRKARELMQREGIPVNDLNRIITNGGAETCLSEDGVHMAEKGNRLLAEAVAEALRKCL